jgi:single-strand DNA-binding protein
MATMNRVFLAGNLTQDVDLRQTNGGTAVADIRLAASDSYTNKEGQQVETVCFADVVVWGRQAETCNEYLGKGSPVLVEGRLETNEWETPQGEKRSKLRIRADRVQFLGKPRNANGNGQGNGGDGNSGSSNANADRGPTGNSNRRTGNRPAEFSRAGARG